MSVLDPSSVRLHGTATTKADAITEAGELLVASGAVDPSYVAAMHEREASVSTFMGMGLAIPHGTNEAKSAIRRSALSFIRYAEPLDWNGNPVTYVVGIAGAGDDHLTLLQQLALVFLEKDQVARLASAQSAQDVLDVLGAGS